MYDSEYLNEIFILKKIYIFFFNFNTFLQMYVYSYRQGWI